MTAICDKVHPLLSLASRFSGVKDENGRFDERYSIIFS
jgi:hypothetical protein